VRPSFSSSSPFKDECLGASKLNPWLRRPDSSQMVGHSSPTFWRASTLRPLSEPEKVGDGYAVIRQESMPSARSVPASLFPATNLVMARLQGLVTFSFQSLTIRG
jgi:hypothetical protein